MTLIPTPPAAPVVSTSAAATVAPATILVVDDRREDLLALEGVLDDPRYKVVTATSGRDALMRVLRQDFAVILLDVHLPGMDGFEIASIIKQRERSRYTPILFMTAAGADMRAIYRAYSVGAVDYLLKPIDRDVVRAKVGIYVELFEKDQRIRQQAEALREAERRQGELELIQERLASARRYRNLAEAIPQIVWTAGPDGAVTYCNARWSTYTGHDQAKAMGWGWTAALHPDDAPDHLEGWRGALDRHELYDAEIRLRGRDGSYRWHLLRAVPEFDDDGRLTGWLGTYTDCDDLKRAHAAAEQAIRARDEFLSIASHELRTPLTALQLQLESLASTFEEDHLDTVLTTRLGKAIKQTGRLEKLIANLLDVSRIMTGKLDLEIEDVDAFETARDVADRFADEAVRAGCTIRVTGAPAPGRWDRMRLEQVVTNLVGNALKYAAGSPIEIVVEPGQAAGANGGAGAAGIPARLRVSDHGIGIAPDSLARIFGRFERAAPSRHYGGLGVGLYITQQIVQAHDGEITVTSQLGQGTQFTIELPVDSAAAAAAASPAEAAMAAEAAGTEAANRVAPEGTR